MPPCALCPRSCRADRAAGQRGYCGAAGTKIKCARAALHMWEEPCISGKQGSGTVFFSGCPLRCVYCQNRDIARAGALSGFYGVLKPMDGVTPYRLEMQARLSAGGSRDLYDFWGSRICEEICAGDADSGEPAGVIINLASKEYSRCVERFLRPETRFITCIFGEWSGGKIAQKGTYAKMARGEMVRFLAERRAESPEEAKKFDRLGYVFDEEHSDNTSWVFIRTEE